MLDEIEHSKWIDDVTKEETMVRLRAMKWQSGNSHIVSNKDHLQNMYDGVILKFFFSTKLKLHLKFNYLKNFS